MADIESISIRRVETLSMDAKKQAGIETGFVRIITERHSPADTKIEVLGKMSPAQEFRAILLK